MEKGPDRGIDTNKEQIHIKWDEVDRSDFVGDPTYQIVMTDSTNDEETTVETQELEYTFKNLKRSRKYLFKIRPKNDWRYGDEFSPEIFIRAIEHRTRPQYAKSQTNLNDDGLILRGTTATEIASPVQIRLIFPKLTHEPYVAHSTYEQDNDP